MVDVYNEQVRDLIKIVPDFRIANVIIHFDEVFTICTLQVFQFLMIVKNVKDITKTIRSVNDLNMTIKDFEHSSFEIEKENRSLKYEIDN